MIFKALRPENPDQITPLLMPTDEYPYVEGGERHLVFPSQFDTSYLHAWRSVAIFSLMRAIKGEHSSLPRRSVHGISELASEDGKHRFWRVIINGRVNEAKEGVLESDDIFFGKASQPIKHPDILVSAALHTYLNLNSPLINPYQNEIEAIVNSYSKKPALNHSKLVKALAIGEERRKRWGM